MSTLTGLFMSPWGAALYTAWRWWVGELVSMIPKKLSWRLEDRPLATVHFAKHETCIERVALGVGERHVDPHPLRDLDDQSWDQLRALIADADTRIILHPPLVYTAPLSLPRQARSHLHQAAELQLREISPLKPHLIQWATHDVAVDGEKLKLGVTMVKRSTVELISERMEALGLPTPDIFGALPTGEVRFPREGSEEVGRMSRIGRSLIVAGLLLISIPFQVLIAASILTWHNDGRADALQEAVRPKLALERKLRRVEQTRSSLATLGRTTIASNILDDVAERLPEGSNLIEVSRDLEGTLRVVIETADPESVRAGLLDNPTLQLIEVDETLTDSGRMRVDYRSPSR